MKNIILIRHAKSDWNNENLTDFERPLNARGLRDAEFMSSKLADKGLHIDCIISSSAVRALTTAQFFAQALSMDKNSIIQHRFLYGASESQYVDIIQEFDDSQHNIILIAHNPSISHVAHILCSQLELESMPTCCMIHIYFPLAKSWKDIQQYTGQLVSIEYPKLYTQNS